MLEKMSCPSSLKNNLQPLTPKTDSSASLWLTARLFSSGHAGSAVQIRQLWIGKVPRAYRIGQPKQTDTMLETLIMESRTGFTATQTLQGLGGGETTRRDRVSAAEADTLQGYPAHEKLPRPRTLQKAYA